MDKTKYKIAVRVGGDDSEMFEFKSEKNMKEFIAYMSNKYEWFEEATTYAIEVPDEK